MTHIIVCDGCQTHMSIEEAPRMFNLTVPGEFIQDGNTVNLDICTPSCLLETTRILADDTDVETPDIDPKSQSELPPLIPQRVGAGIPPMGHLEAEVTRR